MVVRTTRINDAHTGTASARDGKIMELIYPIGLSLNGTKPHGIFFQRRNAPKVEKPATQKAPAASSTGKPSAEALVAISLALQSAAGKPDEVAAVIAMALRSELETQHDHESYVLTIRHRPTMWNAHVQQTPALKR